MRKQSIFASTKIVASAVASTAEEVAMLSTDLVRLARQEVQSTHKANQLENTLDFVTEKTQGLTDLYTQLAELEKQKESDLRGIQIDILKQAIETVKTVNL